MSSNQTQNYQLSQWVKSDQVKMEDFNADNAQIDAALKAEADARTSADGAINSTLAAHAAGLAKRGNCQIYTTSYVGTGKYGKNNPTTLTFPGRPLLVIVAGVDYGVFIALVQGCQHIFHLEPNKYVCIATWQGNSVSWYSSDYELGQLNEDGKTYRVVAFYAMD